MCVCVCVCVRACVCVRVCVRVCVHVCVRERVRMRVSVFKLSFTRLLNVMLSSESKHGHILYLVSFAKGASKL